MEGKDVELLFGLDVLKRHQACIDLRKNCLIINDEEIPFLSEHELPKNFMQQDEVEDSSKQATSVPVQPQQQAPTAGPSAAGSSSAHSEDTIKLLTDMGIGRQEAISALDATGGNPDAAVTLLFQFN